VKRDSSWTFAWHAGDTVDINPHLHTVKVARRLNASLEQVGGLFNDLHSSQSAGFHQVRLSFDQLLTPFLLIVV